MKNVYRDMARSVYMKLKSEGANIFTGKGAIKSIERTLRHIDADINKQNERIENILDNATTVTLAEMNLNYQDGWVDKQDYLETITNMYKDKLDLNSIPTDFDTRLNKFLGKYGEMQFKDIITGTNKTLNQWTDEYKKGKISLYVLNDIIEDFKHSGYYEADLYGKR